MMYIFKFIFDGVAQIYGVMNNFFVETNLSLLIVYLGFLLSPFLIYLFKLGIDISLDPLQERYRQSNIENAKSKKYEKKYIGRHSSEYLKKERSK